MTDDSIEYAVARTIDDAQLSLTRGYAANDPEIREIAKVCIAAVRRYDLQHPHNLPPEIAETLALMSDAVSAGIKLELERRETARTSRKIG